jgi:hypothetical protein
MQNINNVSTYTTYKDPIVSKDVKPNDVGIYFPLECKLGAEYLKYNNLYSDANKNADTSKKGYFSDSGRVRAVKFRGMHKSQGLFMPLESLDYIEGDVPVKVGDEFNAIDDHLVCEKNVVHYQKSPQTNFKKTEKTIESRIAEGQFRFHTDTNMLYKNQQVFDNEDLPIVITYKMHGTSGVSASVLCKRKLSLLEKLKK